MVERNHGAEISHEEGVERRLQVLYARKTREKQIFMEELKVFRRRKAKQMLRSIIDAVGPRWYQALSVPQRNALDALEFSIYQDLLEGRPIRTSGIMRQLGLNPLPTNAELMTCIYLGRDDAKEMLAQLYFTTYGYPIQGKQPSYCLNARLMLSAIFYLGLNNLIYLLQQKFAPQESTAEPPPKPKPKPEGPLLSPYLEKMVAVLYEPRKIRRLPPPPLPDLEDLNEPYEEEPVIQKPPPPPPPPPPPKKTLPIPYCEKLAGIMTIKPHASVEAVPVKKAIRSNLRKAKGSKTDLLEGAPKKKKYGIDLGGSQGKKKRRRKPVAPTTGLWNSQYTINGVSQIHGKTVFVLGNVSILPAQGDLIHGGFAYVKGEYINIHCGFRGRPPPPKLNPCDCVKKWHDSVFQYVKESKCQCGHHYDYGNEGTFAPEELPYFLKPTRHAPIHFNYHTIYDPDEKKLHIEKEFKKIWETDSMIQDKTDTDGMNKEKKDKKSKEKKNRGSTSCLGRNPKPEDYLKCALRWMRRVNIAARLPDLHLVPELKEWMRRRLYGAHTVDEKKVYLRKSTMYWRMFTTLADKGFGHVAPPQEPMYKGTTNWTRKQSLNDKFRQYTETYRLKVFRSYAYVSNLLWRSMYQAEFPDKKFREIYFSYLYGRIEDMHLIHPYSIKESEERKLMLLKKRYICLPAGYEPET